MEPFVFVAEPAHQVGVDAGANTDMAEALVPLAERNQAGDWKPDSTLADDVYNRPDGTIDLSKNDPLDAVPLFGRFTDEEYEH
jgi:hypothetical protein